MKSVHIGWILIALGAMVAPANAEDRGAARQAYSEGSKNYDLGQYAEALAAFKRAYWNFEEPSFLYNIAQCHRALGQKKEAVEAYRSYLRKAPDARNRPEVEKIIAELNSTIEKEKAVATAPPTGTIAGEGKEAPPPPAAKPAANEPETPPARTERPRPKRTWVWGLIGGVVVVGLAVGLGVGLGTAAHPPHADGQVAF